MEQLAREAYERYCSVTGTAMNWEALLPEAKDLWRRAAMVVARRGS